jgi:hypothetical protein
VIHIAFVQPFGEAGRDIGRAIVRQQSGAMNDLCPAIAPSSFKALTLPSHLG